MSSGELCFDFPPSLRVTWTIRDFLWLYTESGHSLQSPDFAFADSRYCLRLFPGRGLDDRIIEIELLNLIDTNPRRAVLCQVQFKSRTVEIDVDHGVSKDGRRFFIFRSHLERQKDLCVPDSTLTVLCSVRLRKPSSAATPKSGGTKTRVTSKSRRSDGKLFSESPPSLYVTWTIPLLPGYFQLSPESRHIVESPKFPFSDRCYRLRFFPDEYEFDVDLVNLTDTVPGRCVSYEVGLKSTSGEEIDMDREGDTSTTRYFYIYRCELNRKKSECFPDGQLTVFSWMHSREPSSVGLPGGIAKLQSDYKQLLLKGVQSNACLVVCGKEFHANQMILRGRSPVFDAMFGHEMAERESGRVVIDDLDPDNFHHFLEYLYTGGVGAGLSDDNAFGLYEAADKYDVPTLKAECVAYMRRSLSMDSFCDALTVALRHSEEELLSRAVLFFRENMPRIIVTPKWKQFATDNSASANEVLIKARSCPQDSETPITGSDQHLQEDVEVWCHPV